MDIEKSTGPYLDSKVDQFTDKSGAIDSLAPLALALPEAQLIKNLNSRIDDSDSYWNSPKGFNLKTQRERNVKAYLGRMLDEGELYRFQIPYNENEIFVGTEATVGYLTSQLPQPQVTPASSSDESLTLATDLEKGLQAHSEDVDLDLKLDSAVRNLILKNVGFLYLYYDPDYGTDGEICVESINPDHITVDKNAALGQNPAFIRLKRKSSVEDLMYRFPEKSKRIMESLGIKYRTPKQMSQEVAWDMVFFTHYEKGQPQEAVACYFNDVMLELTRDPNWIYSNPKLNFLPRPMKPFIAFNYINDGMHWIDQTTPVEQATWLQEVLNKRGRQIMENADQANGLLVISSEAMSMDDAENLTGDPNQKIVIDTNGQPIGNMIDNIQGRELPAYVVEDKVDLRNTIHSILGTPSQFRGDEHNQEDTLGTNIMIKNQAAGRQDLIVRAIDKAMKKYFNLLVQMMVVHYTEKHFKTLNNADGDFDYVELHRGAIERGMKISVAAGSTLPYDKSRQEAIALKLLEAEAIDPLNLYKDLHMTNPQKRYDALAKFKTDPMALARDAMDQLDDSSAYMDYIEILAGETVAPHDDATLEHILIHRKQMITDEFRKSPAKVRRNLMKHVQAEVESLTLRTDLDEMSKTGAEALAPSNPPAPPAPPMPAPSVAGVMGGPQVPMNPMAPGAMPMGGQPSAASVFGGSGLPNPAAPQTQSLNNPAATQAL